MHGNLDFSYVRILKMLYAADEEVRLLAGSALATFAYNSISQQREIADQGGVRFNCFVPFLRSSNEFHRCNAAYQVGIDDDDDDDELMLNVLRCQLTY